jgi:polysaccharide pyruvyl transferase WcaK-like protein
MFKWVLLAKLRKARVLFLSVGYGSLNSRLSRLFTRFALALADYRSYRDAGSRDLMRRAGFAKADPVYPDLAYSRPVGPQPSRLADSIRTVGMSPIAYCDPRVWPERDRRAYESYLERFVDAAVWLIRSGRKLVFFATDGPDHRVIEDVNARVLPRISPSQHAQMGQTGVLSVDDLLKTAVAVDVVVASRLHGLLLSHLAGTPTIAISYDRKVDVHMEAMGLVDYALDIDRFGLKDFEAVFTSLEASWAGVRDKLRTKQAEYGRMLQRQYNCVLCCGTGAG